MSTSRKRELHVRQRADKFNIHRQAQDRIRASAYVPHAADAGEHAAGVEAGMSEEASWGSCSLTGAGQD